MPARRTSTSMSTCPAAPYGGVLVRALADPAHREAILRDAGDRPRWTLTASQAASFELLISGAYSPLDGFMGAADLAACRTSWRLGNGTPWPVPVTLEVSPQVAARLGPGDRLVLRDADGRMLAVQHVSQVWSESPGLVRVSGRVDGVQAPTRYDFTAFRQTPDEIRAAIAGRGWRAAMAVFATDLELDIAQSAVATLAQDLDAGVVVFALDDRSAPADLTDYQRVGALRAWTDSWPADRAILCVVPWNDPGEPGRGSALRAIVASNYGCSHVLSEPLGTAGSSDRFVRDTIEALGIGLIEAPARGAASQRATSQRRGVTVFFTGLSGAGKSTIANALRVRLLEQGRQVSLLDGDLVRQHLSSELGFSREHRELNVRRIAFVAAEVTRHGGVAICAPIAPYDALRTQARAIVEDAGTFLLVYVDTPLDVCEARDTKGLYARARAGLVPSFTGVSDPYEVPLAPDLTVHAAHGSPTDAVDQIVELLASRNLIGR